MAQKKVKPASPCQAAASPGNLLSSPDREPTYSAFVHLGQEPIDVAAMVAARTRVMLPIVRLFAELHGFRVEHMERFEGAPNACPNLVVVRESCG